MVIRGGSVAVEKGALGAKFIGVIFLALQDTPADVQVRLAVILRRDWSTAFVRGTKPEDVHQ
jgi:hypothetical protein